MWSGAWLYFLSHILVFTLWICGQNNPTEGVKINNSYMDTYQLNGDESRQSLMWCKCFSERYSAASLTTICDGLLPSHLVWRLTSHIQRCKLVDDRQLSCICYVTHHLLRIVRITFIISAAALDLFCAILGVHHQNN